MKWSNDLLSKVFMNEQIQIYSAGATLTHSLN